MQQMSDDHIRKSLFLLSRVKLKRKCKSFKISGEGNKSDMIRRLIKEMNKQNIPTLKPQETQQIQPTSDKLSPQVKQEHCELPVHSPMNIERKTKQWNAKFKSAGEYMFLSSYDRYELLISGISNKIAKSFKSFIPLEICSIIYQYYIYKIIKLLFFDEKGHIDENKSITRGVTTDLNCLQILTAIRVELFNGNIMPDIHLWIMFKNLKIIYPINKRNAFVTQQQIDCLPLTQKWKQIPSDYSKIKLNQLSDSNSLSIAIEQQFDSRVSGEWPRAKFKNNIEWNKLESGDIIECKDAQNKWYEALIRYVYPNGHEYENCVVVHYIGWNIKWDERLSIIADIDRDRMAVRGTHTNGPHAPIPKDIILGNIILNGCKQKRICIQSDFNVELFTECLRNNLGLKHGEISDIFLGPVGLIINKEDYITRILPYYLGDIIVRTYNNEKK
eukprot:551737_1